MARAELFIVEGESAASSVRQAMHKPTQSVLATRGKLLNVERTTRQRVLANVQCRQIFAELACGIEEQCNPDHLPYARIMILTDADADGAHARVLLIRLFARYLAALVQRGLVFVVTPPLYRVTDKLHNRHAYTFDRPTQTAAAGQAVFEQRYHRKHFKSIAAMTRSECARWLLRPATRNAVQLAL